MKKIIALLIACVFIFTLAGCSSDKANRALTMDDLKVIAEKGEKISLRDFEPYDYIQYGSGIVQRKYPIGDEYTVCIVLGSSDEISYIELATTKPGFTIADRGIDIRTESIDEFLKKVNG